jgi:ASC-1-like (ASCH) protein
MQRTFVKDVQEPWWSYIKSSHKIYEGRINKGDFHDTVIGDIFVFTNAGRSIKTVLVKKYLFTDFTAYLTQLGLAFTLPGVETIEEGLAVYSRYFDLNDPRGVVTLEILVLD